MKGILDIFLEKTVEPVIERVMRACDRLMESKTKAEIVNLRDYRNGRALKTIRRKNRGRSN